MRARRTPQPRNDMSRDWIGSTCNIAGNSQLSTNETRSGHGRHGGGNPKRGGRVAATAGGGVEAAIYAARVGAAPGRVSGRDDSDRAPDGLGADLGRRGR